MNVPNGLFGTHQVREVLPVKLVSRRLLAALAVIALVASACSSTAASVAPSAPASAPASIAASVAPGTPGPSTCAAAANATQVEVVSWWTTGGEAAGFNQIINKFNCDNPASFVVNSAIAGGAGSNAQAALQARVLANTPPDSFQVHMGHELLDTYVTPGYMDNLDDLYAANGWTTQFPKGVLDIVSAKDSAGAVHYYSVPLDIHRANVLWYNKTVFTANNLTAPKTWDEFFTVADALKAKGITALAVGDNGIWANGMLLESILISALGADGYNGLWTGSTDWAGAKVTAALNTYKKVLTYINTDHSSLSWDQAADYLIPASAGAQPKAAMTLMGDWAAGEFDNKNFTDYGWVAAPGNDKIYDALADSFGLPKAAKNKAQVKAFLTLLGSAAGQDIFNPYKGSIPANSTAGNPPAGAKQYSTYQKWALGEWKADAIVPSLEHGAAAAPAWKGAVETAVTAFVANPDVSGLQTALVQACKDAKVCK
jgi:glucose/mannose transport system substrate-binding protein